MALIALVVIGGATRVMEAGLACPDWPLCYGSLLPGRQMNLKVFLEWFHRLDAFVVGIALLVQLGAAWFWRKELPRWLLPSVVPFSSVSGSSGRPWCSDRAATAPLSSGHSPSCSGPDPGHCDERTDTKTAAHRIQRICSPSLVALAWWNQPCRRV